MPKNPSIKDIALLAGVSAGTVDRVIHNRGNVSEHARLAVEAALSQVGGYRINLHTSAVSYRRALEIIILTPSSSPGDYWSRIESGINEALNEFSDLEIQCTYLSYDQFDSKKCQAVFDTVRNMRADGVIIGPTFRDITIGLCTKLDARGIPYVFVDSAVDTTHPISYFTTNQLSCGQVLGRLIKSSPGKIAVLSSRRQGTSRASNSILREQGVVSFFEETGERERLLMGKFSSDESISAEMEICDFLNRYPEISGVAVLNSRGYVIADVVRKYGFGPIDIFCFDLTKENHRCLMNGSISALICQRPVDQGYNAISAILHQLIYKGTDECRTITMPIDIVFKESLPYYRESARTSGYERRPDTPPAK